jgi:serine phosphatase RsbU (regulator of sigma subunit)
MKLSIKNIIVLIFVSELGLLGSLAYVDINLRKTEDNFKKAVDERFDLLHEADILRQSSDDLTRLARTYVVTNDTQYKDDYFKILDIRNGVVARPRNYEAIYWDLLEPERSERHPDDIKISHDEIFSKLPYSDEERLKLKFAEKKSNALVNIEVEAFNAMEGLFKDEHGEYTIKGEPDQSLAIQLLHSSKYHAAKHSIMLPIDDFMIMLGSRTQNNLIKAKESVEYYLKLEYLLVFTFILFNIFILILLNRRIIEPVLSITDSIVKHKNKEQPLKFDHSYDDEIKIMADKFEQMNNDLTDLNQQVLKWQSRVQREIDLASDVQQQFLPQFHNKNFPVYASNIPAVEISGDFYDVLVNDPNNIYFAFGDVAGKGVHAGMVMTQIVSLFRAHAKTDVTPAKIINSINNELVKTSVKGMFTTLVIGLIDTKEKNITFSNAGHIPPMIRKSNGEFIVTDITSHPVGILSETDPDEFVDINQELSDGAFYIFTDGITEIKTANGNELGLDGLKQLIEDNCSYDKKTRVNNILSDIQLGKEDDITLMVIEFN